MQALSPMAILNVWEQGSVLHPVNRALLVLRHACPETADETLSALSLGRRDALLLEVRQHIFGDRLEAYTECPGCGERLEFSCSCRSLLAETPPQAGGERTIVVEGCLFRLRCPDSHDAAAVAMSGTLEAARRTLLSRCVSPADASEMSIDALPEPVHTAIASELAAIDPQAEVLLDLCCPACGRAWQAVFDILPFLWTEIRARARRLLQEIDVLARTYGWAEADILGMSEARRGLYLQMAMS
jgi:hypothetical protein